MADYRGGNSSTFQQQNQSREQYYHENNNNNNNNNNSRNQQQQQQQQPQQHQRYEQMHQESYNDSYNGQQQQQQQQVHHESYNNSNNNTNNAQQQQQQQQPAASNAVTTTTTAPAVSSTAPGPFAQPLRWVLMVFLVLGVGAGIVAHIAANPLFGNTAENVMWTQSSGVNIGIWSQCSTAICVNIFPINANTCTTGLSTSSRVILFVSFVTAGLVFAFAAWIFVFLFAQGSVGHIFRHVLIFLSFACWVVGICLFHWYLWADGCAASFENSARGIGFWLACGACGASFVALILSIVVHVFGPASAGATDNNQVTNEEYYNNNNNNNNAHNQLNDTTYSNANGSTYKEGPHGDGRDPASVGLGPDWYFDDESGFWWSDEAQLYYDAGSQSYGNPQDGTWYNAETGEWQ